MKLWRGFVLRIVASKLRRAEQMNLPASAAAGIAWVCSDRT
jgi:hypothetical protein